jgi:hypothetical protein
MSDDSLDTLKKVSTSANRVLFLARQKTFGEAAMADIYDIAVGIVPFIGDYVTTAPRIADAGDKTDLDAGIVHSIDAVIGVVPVVGDLIDGLIPANTILKTQEYFTCVNNGSKALDCAIPKDTLDREVIEKLNIDTAPIEDLLVMIPKFNIGE